MSRFPHRTAPLLPLLLLLAAPLAASPRWVPLGPYGGSVERLAVDPSDDRVIYALTGEKVLFKSANGGANWTPLRMFDDTYESVRSIAVDPARHGTVYLAAEGKLLKSVDGGASWSETGPRSGVSISAVAVDPARASRVYAGGSGIWVSTNRGASWKASRPFLSSGYIRLLVAARQPAGTVFATTSSGVYKSMDAGFTWHALPLPGGTREVGPFAAAPTDSRRLYASFEGAGFFRSTDGGETWQPAGRQPGEDDKILSLAVSPRSARTLWLVTERSGLFRSTDGGDNWTASGPQPVQSVAVVAVAPSSPRTVYAGLVAEGADAGGVFASTDAGSTWVRRNRGLFGLEVGALALDPSDPDTLWAGHRGGLYRSANGGTSWVRMALPAPPAWGYSFDIIVVDPTVPSTVYALCGSLWKTLDGGASWTDLFATGASQPGLRLLRIAPDDPSKLWGVGGAELFTSADAGGHWDRLEYPQAGCGLYDLAFAPSSPSTLYLAGSSSVPGEICFDAAAAVFFRSTDGGATWNDAGSGLRGHGFDVAGRIAVDPVDPRWVYVGTAAETKYGTCDGVWKSTDGGTTWARAGKNIGCITAVAASPVAGVIWASTEQGRIFRSGDAGTAWRDRTKGLLAHWVYDLVIDAADPRRVYAVTSGGVWVWEDETR